MSHAILSVRQPWAGLLVSGVKRYEVRSWAPAVSPGWVLIHASAGKAGNLHELHQFSVFNVALKQAGMDDERQWARSAIIGAVRFSAFLDTWRADQVPKRMTSVDRVMVGDSPDRYLWKADKAIAFRSPISCDGKLKLWRPAPGLTKKIDRVVEEEAPAYRPLLA